MKVGLSLRIGTTTSQALTVALLTLSLALPVRAEDAASTDPKTAALTQMASNLNSSTSALQQNQTNLQNQMKQIVQQEQQDQQDASRRKSQQTAAALAGVGAAIAGVGCVLGMRAAQQQTDPSMKAMMMSMAMQQCSQAAQSAANAAKNDDGQQQLADNSNDPTSAPLPTTTVPTVAASETPSPGVADSPTPDPTSQIADGTATQPPSVFEATGTPSVLTSGTTVAGTANGTSDLAPIPDTGTTYDESAKAGTGGGDSNDPNSSSGGLGSATLTGIASAAGNAASDVLNKLSDAVSGKHGKSDEGDAGAIGGGGGEGGASAAGGGGSEKGEDGKDSNINSMLAGMMGPNGGPVAGGPREDVLSWRPAGAGAAANGQKPPNIFQYAGYRMKKLGKEGTVHRSKRMAARGLASAPASLQARVASFAGAPATADRKPASVQAPQPTPAQAPAKPVAPPSAQNLPPKRDLVAVKP